MTLRSMSLHKSALVYLRHIPVHCIHVLNVI